MPGVVLTNNSIITHVNIPCSCVIIRHAEEVRRAGVIADERRRLLAQAADLADYLPPGVLKNTQELDLLRQQQQQQ